MAVDLELAKKRFNRRGFFGALFGAATLAPATPKTSADVVFAPFPICGRCGDALTYLERNTGTRQRASCYRCRVIFEFELPHAKASVTTHESVASGR